MPHSAAAQGIRTLLASLYAAQGQLLPVDASALREGSTVAVRLANWNQLLPALKKFAVDFSADEKTLLIGGGARRTRAARAVRAYAARWAIRSRTLIFVAASAHSRTH